MVALIFEILIGHFIGRICMVFVWYLACLGVCEVL